MRQLFSSGQGGDDRRQELARMRAIATGLLVGMLGLFLLATWFQAAYPWLAYVRAFAEAAMVGALADWFAVAALFRHPLGLPIPHTAVIPRNKDRIGESLGRFVEEHFLPAQVISARLADIDFSALVAHWLADAGNAERLSEQLTALLPRLLARVNDETVRGLVRDKLTERLEKIEIAGLAGEILAVLTAENRHQLLLDEVLGQSVAIIAEKEPLIRQKVRDSTGWLWQKLSVDERAFNGIMNALEDLVREVKDNSGHELRQRFDRAVRDFVLALKDSEKFRAEAEAVKREVIRNAAFQGYLAGIWDELRAQILKDVESPGSEIRDRMQAAIPRLGAALLGDAAMREALNGWLRTGLAELVEARRHQVARLIPDTVRTWDAATMAERLELQVGKDLQFVRINGTLVGGLVGLLIHVLTRLAGA